ncbi:hypothetical protein QBC35DRAFT_69095 [Podospora australis]|uniref:Uncharacterized protein n=1 Tax=Podospora australis TaxID=1536484 RepID=A0AAN6WLH0_9PEZI|nr:hypothetical protein QBC35DRAFT_69095 [Podospora australis]
MVGKDDLALGAHFHPKAQSQSSSRAAPDDGDEETPPPAVKDVRPITPKLHRFSNLGAAHHAITARIASRSAAAPAVADTHSAAPSVSPVDDAHPSGSVESLPVPNLMEFAKSIHVVKGRCLTGYIPRVPGTKEQAEVSVDPSPAQPPPQISHPSPYDDFDIERDYINGPGPEILYNRAPRETGSTVENIHRQYLPSTLTDSATPSDALQPTLHSVPLPANKSPPSPGSTQEDGSDEHYVLAHAHSPKSPEVGHTAGSLDIRKQRRQLYDAPGSAPSVPLPQLPKGQVTTRPSLCEEDESDETTGTATPSTGSISNSQILLNKFDSDCPGNGEAKAPGTDNDHSNRDEVSSQDAVNHNGGAHDAPQHFNPMHLRNYPGGGIGQAEFSTGAFTTESDEDPFKYDRNSYTIFLQPSREREVSVALQRLSSSFMPDLGTELSPGPWISPTPSPEHDIPAAPAPATIVTQTLAQPVLQSNNPFLNNLQFYRNPVIQSEWTEQDEPAQVSIAVQRSPSQESFPKPESFPDQGALVEGWDDNSLYSAGIGRNTPSEGFNDWETVGESVGQFDSQRACASGTGLSGSHDVKETGSSIADYSDFGGYELSQYDAFASTDRILQHPPAPGTGTGPTNRVFRTLNDNRPIFLPKPRMHRVNGFPLDSCRVFSEQTFESSTSSARSALERLGSRFRRNPKGTEQRFDPYRALSDPELSDVFEKQTSPAGGIVKTKGKEKEVIDNVARGKENASGGRVSPSKLNRITPPEQTGVAMSGGSGTLFSFPLISLREAAKKQAVRTSNGGDDLTITSGERSRYNSSTISSRTTQRTTPPTPCIEKPTPAHLRRPTGLGFPDSTPHRPRYSLERAFNRHGANPSIASHLSSGSPSIYGRAVFPRSCRNPFGDARGRGSMRRSFNFPAKPQEPATKEPQPKASGKSRQATPNPRLKPHVDLETGGDFVLSSENVYLSWDARRKQQSFFYLAMAMCVLPFMALLVYKGSFDSALSWYTKGEVARLTHRQRRSVAIAGSSIAAV